MTEKKTQLVIAFCAIGVLLLSAGLFLVKRGQTSAVGEFRLARVERETGDVFTIRTGYAQREKVIARSPLYNLDSVETADTGDALITFESAFRVRVMENSLVTLEKVDDQESYHVVLIVKRGEIKVENFGRDGELVIGKNGERVNAADYNGSQLSLAPAIPPQSLDSFSEPIKEQGLSGDEISATLAQNKTQFFKCYTQVLQKTPTAKGSVSMSFTVENSGKLSLAEITASEIQDDQFKNCLKEVLKRIEFKAFNGAPIATIVPMHFE